MELSLLPILNCEGKRMPVDISLELEASPKDGFRILNPITVKGDIVNIGGCIELSAEGSAELELTCGRCAESFTSVVEFSVEEKMRKESDDAEDNDNPDITIFEGNSIDISGIVYDSLALGIPTKMLCSENCEGICPVCGQNLNIKHCDCNTETTDPRFDILDTLL